MSAAVGGRDDYDASTLCGLSRTSEDLRQAQRLLSLACVHDGMSRADAAKGVGWTDRTRGTGGTGSMKPGPKGLFDHRVLRCQMRMRPRWLNLLRSSNPAPALSMTLEHDGGVRWRRPDLQRGSEDRFGVVSHERTLSRLPAAPGFSRLTGRPQHPAQAPGQDLGLMEAFKKRPPKPCLPFEPRSGRQADRGLGSGRGPHPGAQGDETAMAGRSALQTGLPVRP